ncbi:MAG: FHA domain-containing protein [Tannerellaceae bacterium]|nr:FHA domain-containing protein [Tannerellaceae bacterium]
MKRLQSNRKKEKKGYLTVTESEETPQQTIPLPEGKYTLGHKSSTLTETVIGIVTSDRSMSRAHICIETVKDHNGSYKFYLSDNKSKNHTLYNSSYLQEDEVVMLKDGDEIILGRTILHFHE